MHVYAPLTTIVLNLIFWASFCFSSPSQTSYMCASSFDYLVIDSSPMNAIGHQLVRRLLTGKTYSFHHHHHRSVRLLKIGYDGDYDVTSHRIRTYTYCGLGRSCNQTEYDDAHLN